MNIATPARTLGDVIFPPMPTRSWPIRLARELAIVIGFAWFVALFAQIVFRLPFTTVPITGQTFAVLATGGTLGAWRGAGALTTYMILAIVGTPVLAPSLDMSGQTFHILFPWEGTAAAPWDISSGGYVVGFILASWVAGKIAEMGWHRGPWLMTGLLFGNIILYIPGLLWLAYLISSDWLHPAAQLPLGELIAGGSTLEKTLVGGLYPFILGDLIKLYLASLMIPSAWVMIRKLRGL